MTVMPAHVRNILFGGDAVTFPYQVVFRFGNGESVHICPQQDDRRAARAGCGAVDKTQKAAFRYIDITYAQLIQFFRDMRDGIVFPAC